MFVRSLGLEQGKERCHDVNSAADSNGARDSAHNKSGKITIFTSANRTEGNDENEREEHEQCEKKYL